MPVSKRRYEIDLTNDSDVENRYKKHKSKVLPTPPSSSQPLRSSQPKQNLSRSSSFQNTAPSSSQWSYSQQQSINNDISRDVDLDIFDDDAAWYDDRQLYGVLTTKVVGIRFYSGHATIGEYVMVRRQPENQYDKNAIRIDNVRRQQIGHIGRQMAAKLAPLMDSGELVIEGSLLDVKGEFDVPIALKLFGTSIHPDKWALRSKMMQLQLPVVELNKTEAARQRKAKELEKQAAARAKAVEEMRKRGQAVYDANPNPKYAAFPVEAKRSSEPDLEQLLSNTAIIDPRNLQKATNRLAQSEEDLAKLPEADQPTELVTQLLPYQRQGLKWMLEHESPAITGRDPVQFWKKFNDGYLNIVTRFLVTSKPELASGGILADDMGLGKTIQVLSLIMADPHKNGQPTLIVAPLSVMSNWKNQAALHIKQKYAPRVLIYHGSDKKDMIPDKFKEYDIVVTTYQTMALDLFIKSNEPEKVPTARGLFSVNWRRVVLDEGHNIRNPRSKMARAAYSLQATSRWVLTGTPIVNSLKDLYSHVKFLRLSGGLSEFEIFNASIIRPAKDGLDNGKAVLQSLMQMLCLRRMKDMKFVNLKLPDLTYHKHAVKFLSHEQERYDAFRAEAKGLLQAAKANDGDYSHTYLLEVLLRLRQTCNHWKMCGQVRINKVMKLLESSQGKTIDINPINKKALQDLLQLRLDSQEECPICYESICDRQPVITACGHAFCQECITTTINTQHKCPICRAELPSIDLLILPAANFGEGVEDLDLDPEDNSSKIDAILKVLQATDKQDKDMKTVIFSQWTSFLDLLEPHLQKIGLDFARLDGKMNPLRRDLAIERLTTHPDCRIILASLSACSVGINLTAANQVILADSWWAPAVEDQAVDRVYRLGQTKPCRVVRFVIENTIEDEVLEIQKTKRDLVGQAFGETKKRGEEARQERLREIERLLR